MMGMDRRLCEAGLSWRERLHSTPQSNLKDERYRKNIQGLFEEVGG
jgi:hypothetical protein